MTRDPDRPGSRGRKNRRRPPRAGAQPPLDTEPEPPQLVAHGTVNEPGAATPTAPGALSIAFDRALSTLHLHFQPIVVARTGALYGFEALMRTGDVDLPGPGAMLEAAEALRRIHELGRSVRGLAARDYAAAAPANLFVNLHATELGDRTLGTPACPLYGVRHRIVLEITERASLDTIPYAQERVRDLRALGYRVAIDDLGAGHSRMGALTVVETDFVKLDISLVRGVETHAMKQKLIAAMTELCQSEGISVVAEGVETEDARDTLIDLGCDLVQGYVVARPEPAPVVPALRWPGRG